MYSLRFPAFLGWTLQTGDVGTESIFFFNGLSELGTLRAGDGTKKEKVASFQSF